MRQILSILVLAVGLAACQDTPKNGHAEVVVLEVRGDVTGGPDFHPLAPGDRLSLREGIKVGDGRAVVEMPDGTLIKLYAKTRLKVAGERQVNLTLGKIWLAVSKSVGGKEFRVETANAVAGVRGTELIVQALVSLTRVSVVSGTVEVASRRAPEDLHVVTKGKQVIVEGGRPVSKLAPFEPDGDAKAWDALGDEHPETPPEPEPTPEPGPKGETDAAPETPTKAATKPPERKKNAHEREGEATKKKLEREAEKTRRDLDAEEKKIRKDIERDREKAKGDVKDFLK